jgi:hypothetical protein
MAATAALVIPTTGPYIGDWNNLYLGTQNDDGFVLTAQYTGQEVNASDQYGMTLVEAIYRGINWRLRFRSLEFQQAGILAAIQAFGSTGSAATTFTPYLNPQGGGFIGHRYSHFAQTLLLTALLSITQIQSLTALLAIVAPNSNIELLMTSKVREAPLEMVLLPYNVTVGSLSVDLAFTTT